MLSRLKFLRAEKDLVDGFTLIEVLVSMFIFSIAILGLAVGATSIMRANQTSYYNTLATNWAQDKLEELKAMTASSITACSTNCDSPAKTAGNVTFTRTWTVTSPCNGVSGLKCISITVTWTDYTNHTLAISSAVKE